MKKLHKRDVSRCFSPRISYVLANLSLENSAERTRIDFVFGLSAWQRRLTAAADEGELERALSTLVKASTHVSGHVHVDVSAGSFYLPTYLPT